METLNNLIEQIKTASKANDGVRLSQLKIELAILSSTFGEDLRQAKADYADTCVGLLKPNKDTGKSISVAQSELEADFITQNKHDGIKYQIEAIDRILTAMKDQISVYLSEKGLTQ